MNILPIPGRGHARVPAEKAAQGRLVGKIDTRHDRLQVHRRFPEQRLDLENREADDPVPCRLPADLVHQVGQVLRSDPEPLAKYATSLLGECSSTTVRMNRNASSSLWV